MKVGQERKAFKKGQLSLNPLENSGRCREPWLRGGSGVCTASGEGYTGGPLILRHFQSAKREGKTGLTGRESPQAKRCWQLLNQANVHGNDQDGGHE